MSLGSRPSRRFGSVGDRFCAAGGWRPMAAVEGTGVAQTLEIHEKTVLIFELIIHALYINLCV